MDKKWYQKSTGVIALLAIFFPFGLYMMWKHADWDKKTKLGISAGLTLLIIVISASGGSGDKQQETTTTSKISAVPYTLVEEKDISIINCTRVTYKIKVADNADKEAVKLTAKEIINKKKSTWNDITVWTYKESESDEFIKNNGYTVDMAEYSTCK